jgi:lipopolysaccharide exporter
MSSPTMEAAAPLAGVRRAAIRGSAWSVSGGLGTRVLGLVGTMVLTRFVAPYDFGEVSAATILALTANQFSNLGVGTYVIAHPQAGRETIFHATFVHLTLGLLAFALLLAAAGRFGPALGAPTMLRYLPGLVLAAALERINFMPERVLTRRMQFGSLALIKGGGDLTYTVVSVAAAATGAGGMAIVIGNVARSGLRLVTLLSTVSWRDWIQPARLNRAILRDVLVFGSAVFLAGLGAFALRSWDNLIVSHLHGPAVLGAYALAFSLACLPAAQVGEQIADVLQAALARTEGGDRRRVLVRAMGILALVTTPMAVGLAAVGPGLVQTALDGRWAGVAPMLAILSLISFVSPLNGVIAGYLQVQRMQWLVTLLEALTLLVLGVALFGPGRLGPRWACAAVSSTYLVRLLLSAWALRFTDGIKPHQVLFPLVMPVACSLLMAAVVWGVRAGAAATGIPPAPSLVLQVLAGALAYGAALSLAAPARTRELFTLVRSGFR